MRHRRRRSMILTCEVALAVAALIVLEVVVFLIAKYFIK